MAGSSTVTLMVKLGGSFAGKTAADFVKPGALYAYAAGLALTIAVGSLFKLVAT